MSGRPAKDRNGENAQLVRLEKRARLVLAWERAWPPLAGILSLAAAFCAISWVGFWIASPLWLRVAGLLSFCVATGWFLLLLAKAWFVPQRDRIARLDHDSGSRHGPASSSADSLANGASDPTTSALWELHQRRQAAALDRLKVRPPSPQLPQRDRYAFRAAAILACVAAGFVAGPTKIARMLAAFDLSTPGAPAAGFRLDAWVDPPGYTGKPPILLAGGTEFSGSIGGASLSKTVTAPVGSVIVVRSANMGSLNFSTRGALRPNPDKSGAGAGRVTRPAANARGDLRESRWILRGDGKLLMSRYGGNFAQFAFRAIPNKPPVIALLGKPKANASGSLTLSYSISDQYGVSGAQAHFSEPRIPDFPKGRALVAPPKMPLSLPPGARGLGKGETTADLSKNPWAGARVMLTLSARDDAGDEGMSDPVRMTLPEKPFTQPMARALVEQRRNLVLDPDHRRRVAAAIDALMIAPEEFAMSPSVYLGLTAISYRLADARTDADLLSVADLMWEMALRIENGDLSKDEQDLRAAQQRLKDALARHASPDEVRKLMDQLRASLDKYLQSLARRSQNDSQMAQIPPQSRMLTQRDLNSMLDRLQQLAQSGDLAQAQRLLDQLQSMLENLRSARRGDPMQSQMSRGMNELDRLTRQQQALRDRTFQQGQSGEPEGGNKSSRQLQQEQQALRERLQGLEQEMNRLGLDPKKGLGQAEQAMRQAEGALGRGQSGDSEAVGAQGRALQALREGAQSLAQQMQRNGMAMGMGRGDGPGQPGFGRNDGQDEPRDPLGREANGRDYDSNSRFDPLGTAAAQRAQQVLEELRRRVGNARRPREELDYYDRLLHPY